MIHYLWYMERTLLIVRWNGKLADAQGCGQARRAAGVDSSEEIYIDRSTVEIIL